MEIVEPHGWPRGKGYAPGVIAQGRIVFVSGQIGWDERGRFVGDDLVSQARRALENVVAVVRAAGGEATNIARLTWYVTDKRAYLAGQRELGRAYREVMGTHYPAMAVVVVSALVEDAALVEIEATAVLSGEAS